MDIKELWTYRELFYFFSWRDIKVKYKQTILGLVWVVLQPLIMMTIFTVFFSRALNVQSTDLPYPVFCFTGLLFWNLFSSGLTSAGNSMVSNANIIKKIYFPRLIIPVSTIIVSLFDFLITVGIFAGLLVYWKFLPSANILFCFPIALIITLLTTMGAGFLLSALNVKYRDFRYIIPFMVQILLFVTPVIYPISLIKNDLIRSLLNLNPIATAIQLARTGLVGGEIPWLSVVSGIFASVCLLFIGLFVFRSVENEFADIA
ncbi:MAG TPA: ABC transporter permease [Bacteroidia bacterium]|nr:ABC transporter permease [Bacteroidia bacterium]